MKEKANFLAVDLGASSGRVVLGQWDGNRFELEELHRFRNGPVSLLGRLHWDVLALWEQIKIGLGRYAARYSSPPAGISVDTWGVDFALLDRTGQLLGNPYHYRDRRTNGLPERLFERVPKEEIFARTGIQFMQINTLFQLYSLVEAEDPQLEVAETLLMMPDLFHYWMTGEQVAEYTIATTSQLFDAHERRWATGLLGRLDMPPHLFPEIIQPGSVLGPLLPAVREEIGFRETVPVIATGSHDTASAVAAVPDLDENSVYISSGTWSLVGVEIASPIINEQSLRLNFTNEGGVGNRIRLLKNVGGLWLLQESRRHWRREGREYEWAELVALAEQAEPLRSIVDPDAPDFLSPGDMPGAIRAYCRRSGQPEPEDVGAVVRCCLESLALRYAWVLDALETLTGRHLETIRIVGGGSQNRLLSQLTADACQRPVVAGPVEATALGNLMLQAIATGHLPDIAAGRQAIAASAEQARFEPAATIDWEGALHRFRALIQP